MLQDRKQKILEIRSDDHIARLLDNVNRAMMAKKSAKKCAVRV